MKKVAIVGFGVEGKSALPYWKAQGADVTVCDKNEKIEVPEGVKTQLGADYLKDLDRFDIIVRTVGMHPKVILAENPDVKDKITTNLNEFFRVSPTKNIIGVTGTKGKGTTSTLITKMLQAAGKQTFLGGNYGVPAFTFLPELTEESWVVLELSSFMLYDIQCAPHIAVCLMMAPEHLDWHDDAEDYYNAKANMFAHQKSDDIAIYFAENTISHRIASASPGDKIAYYDEPGAYVHDNKIMIDQTVICKTDEIKLLGKHNWQNACAAATAFWQVMQAPDAIRKVLTTFTGLGHRLELVRELDGVKYYDDSFGTTPETCQVAIEAVKEPKILILGGSDKGADFTELAKTVKSDNVRRVILMGNTTSEKFPTVSVKVFEALRDQGFDAITSLIKAGGPTIQEVVATAQDVAKKGDAVLLSTGCASFDMFKDYIDRGNQFKAAVHEL